MTRELKEELKAFFADFGPLFETREENIYLVTAYEVYMAMRPLLVPGARIADMGCYTGALVAWLATKHPECQVFGFDRDAEAIEVAKELVTCPNVEFAEWDYLSDASVPVSDCDIVVSTLGTDFTIDDFTWECSLDTANLGASEFCRRRVGEALPYFQKWRGVCKPGGQLIAVLRIKNVDHHFSIVEAAHQAGWSFDAAQSRLLQIAERPFPLVRFAARESRMPSATEIMGSWDAQEGPLQAGQVLDYIPALVVYESLSDKRVLYCEDSPCTDGPHTVRISVGVAGDIGFVFQRFTTGYAELELISPNEAEECAAQMAA